jgi:hypothetical protein
MYYFSPKVLLKPPERLEGEEGKKMYHFFKISVLLLKLKTNTLPLPFPSAPAHTHTPFRKLLVVKCLPCLD